MPRAHALKAPALLAAFGFGRRGQQASRHLLIEGKQVLDPFPVAVEESLAVEAVDGLIQRAVCPTQLGRHEVGMVGGL